MAHHNYLNFGLATCLQVKPTQNSNKIIRMVNLIFFECQQPHYSYTMVLLRMNTVSAQIERRRSNFRPGFFAAVLFKI